MMRTILAWIMAVPAITWEMVSVIQDAILKIVIGTMVIVVPAFRSAGNWKHSDFPPPVGINPSDFWPDRAFKINEF